MNPAGLLRKIFRIKEDYVETILGSNSPEEDKQNLEKFINKIKINRGKLMSIGTATCSEQRYEYVERFDASRKDSIYSSGYFEDCDNYTDLSHHFIIHYRCNKRIEEKDL
jgi:hypothetical protein